MPKINLIFEQRQLAKAGERKTRLFFFAFAGTASLAAVGFATLLFLTEAGRGEQASLMANAQKVKPLVEELETVNSEASKLAPRVKTLEDARVATDRWNHVLDQLTTATPTETWLTSIRAEQPDPKKPILITFAGMTTKQERIGDFMLKLQENEDLTGVNFKYSQEKPVTLGSQLEFQVEASLVGTAPEEKTAKKEEE